MMEEPIVILLKLARHKAMPKVDMDDRYDLCPSGCLLKPRMYVVDADLEATTPKY
jgi:hypothetical protein